MKLALLMLAAALAIPSTVFAQQVHFTNPQSTKAQPPNVPSTNAQTAAQKSEKKSFTLRGVVEGVDAKAGRLTVNHEKVEGWMGAMTMAYAVDKPEDLPKLKIGDHIEATVYQDEYKLYNIRVASQK